MATRFVFCLQRRHQSDIDNTFACSATIGHGHTDAARSRAANSRVVLKLASPSLHMGHRTPEAHTLTRTQTLARSRIRNPPSNSTRARNPTRSVRSDGDETTLTLRHHHKYTAAAARPPAGGFIHLPRFAGSARPHFPTREARVVIGDPPVVTMISCFLLFWFVDSGLSRYKVTFTFVVSN